MPVVSQPAELAFGDSDLVAHPAGGFLPALGALGGFGVTRPLAGLGLPGVPQRVAGGGEVPLAAASVERVRVPGPLLGDLYGFLGGPGGLLSLPDPLRSTGHPLRCLPGVVEGLGEPAAQLLQVRLLGG